MELQKLKDFLQWENIVSGYVGKPGCRCGCNGDYFYTNHNKIIGGKERGYVVEDFELNDLKVKRIVNKLLKNYSGVENIDDYIFNFEVGNRVYTIYLKEKTGRRKK